MIAPFHEAGKATPRYMLHTYPKPQYSTYHTPIRNPNLNTLHTTHLPATSTPALTPQNFTPGHVIVRRQLSSDSVPQITDVLPPQVLFPSQMLNL